MLVGDNKVVMSGVGRRILLVEGIEKKGTDGWGEESCWLGRMESKILGVGERKEVGGTEGNVLGGEKNLFSWGEYKVQMCWAGCAFVGKMGRKGIGFRD